VGVHKRITGTFIPSGMDTQRFTAEDLVAMATKYEDEQAILDAITDPEAFAALAFDLGLDIPSLTSWYLEQEHNN